MCFQFYIGICWDAPKCQYYFDRDVVRITDAGSHRDDILFAVLAAVSIKLQGFFDALAYGMTPSVIHRWKQSLCGSSNGKSGSFSVEFVNSDGNMVSTPMSQFESQSRQPVDSALSDLFSYSDNSEYSSSNWPKSFEKYGAISLQEKENGLTNIVLVIVLTSSGSAHCYHFADFRYHWFSH